MIWPRSPSIEGTSQYQNCPDGRELPASDARHGLLEQLQPLGTDFRRENGHSGKVSARPRQALHEARFNGVSADCHNYRNRGGF